MKLVSLYLLFLLKISSILSEQTYPNIKELRSNIGSTQDLIRVDLGMSEIYPNTRVVYYIDLNGDKMVDIIGVNRQNDLERVVFSIYNPTTGKFDYQELSGVSYPNAYIKNVIANDFNGDEQMDLMITLYYKESNKTQVHILLYDQTTQIYKTVYKFQDVISGLMVADLSNTRGLDIIFFDEERKYLYFDENSNPVVKSFNELISKDLNICDRSKIHVDFPISNPHSSAFVDMDGDCINDLVIMSKGHTFNDVNNTTESQNFLEIWRGVIEDNEIKYCLTQSSVYKLDSNLGLFSLADIDRDSLLDIIFPVKNSTQILIAYNRVPLDYDWTQDYCATHNKFTQTTYKGLNSIQIPIIFDEIRINSMSKFIKVHQLTPSPTQIFFNNENVETFLRFGDMNQDSYPDFTVVIYDKSDFSHNAYVFLNSPDDTNVENSRSFSLTKSYINPYVSNAIYSSFFDFDEDGKLDLIIVKQENNTISTEGYLNTYVYDSFYLKSLVLNQQNSLFANELGTSFRFITTNIDGSRRMDFSAQAIQVSTQLALNLPYAYMGIGRSNNYIENFHVISGNFVEGKYNYKIFTPIIPNSQIIIRHFKELNFYQKKNNNTIYLNNLNNTSNLNNTEVIKEEVDSVSWHLDLIVKPTTNLPILITLIVIILMSLFVAIVYLQINETKEDSAENQREFQFW